MSGDFYECRIQKIRSPMSTFKETWEEFIQAQKKYEKECQNEFLCELLQYFMTLDYKALSLDAIKDGYYAYEILNHPKLCFLSDSQKEICEKIIFKTLKKQHLVDENMSFEHRKDHSDDIKNDITPLYIVRLYEKDAISWMLHINPSHRIKNGKGLCITSFTSKLYKLLPPGDHFISGYTL